MRKKTFHPPPSPCAIIGCFMPGDYKAPKSRHNTSEYQYLCLEHVQEFNQAWDYFAGWSQQQIEEFMDNSHHGHRPTWTMSARLGEALFPLFSSENLKKSFFEMLDGRKPIIAPRMPRAQREALEVFELQITATLPEIKAQYKKLVKKYHPDVTKNDKLAEERFKKVTHAYKVLVELYEK